MEPASAAMMHAVMQQIYGSVISSVHLPLLLDCVEICSPDCAMSLMFVPLLSTQAVVGAFWQPGLLVVVSSQPLKCHAPLESILPSHCGFRGLMNDHFFIDESIYAVCASAVHILDVQAV